MSVWYDGATCRLAWSSANACERSTTTPCDSKLWYLSSASDDTTSGRLAAGASLGWRGARCEAMGDMGPTGAMGAGGTWEVVSSG